MGKSAIFALSVIASTADAGAQRRQGRIGPGKPEAAPTLAPCRRRAEGSDLSARGVTPTIARERAPGTPRYRARYSGKVGFTFLAAMM